MTNKEGIDTGDETCDSRLAALLAVHLVGQVLDEANIIANAARESGQPWRYLMMMKNIRSDKPLKISNEDVSYATSKGDNVTFIKSKKDDAQDLSDDKADELSNIVVTSTPQKKSDAVGNNVSENSLIGQGDEVCEKQGNDVTNYTSTYINHLFDMSEVEKIHCDDNISEYYNNIPTHFEENTSLLQDITKIIESYVNAALNMALISETQENEPQITRNSSSSTDPSGYSFLSDAFVVDIAKDDGFFNNDGESNVRVMTVEPINEEDTSKKDIKDNEDVGKEIINTALYENAYLTLNRDYEQCSEEGYPVLQDPKGLSLQEIELMTAQTSQEDLSVVQELQEQSDDTKELAATSAISAAASGSRKSNLVHRCRTQGARLLACLRGWWRRKTPGKRKEFRVPGSIRGLYPLSPEARCRAASMLDQRHLCSPTPSRSVVWKFNTVNEALVKSSRWKEYTFDVRPNE